MCGRYTLVFTMEELASYLGVDSLPFEWQPRYNIAPGQHIPAVIAHQGQRRIGLLRWGLVPNWAHDEQIAYKLINARAETVHEKPSFKASFERKRCLIPADGFYEWKKEQHTKQPMRITKKDRSLFMMAGLYDVWTKPDGSRLATCTIITTKPNSLVAPIHDRMPVIMRPEDEALWLEGDGSPQQRSLTKLLVPYPEEEMEAYPVSPDVGNVKNDNDELIRPVTLDNDILRSL